RERGQGGGHAQVALSEAVEVFTEPLRHEVTTSGGILGGGLPQYNLYPAQQGWVALAALEPDFWQRFREKLGLSHTPVEIASLQTIFMTKTAGEWEKWATECDMPLAAVLDIRTSY
ncbi:MAG TPA: CoA transferase, partial [Pyrinomonadaceae bacterium]|nr:CoA transferase [Pyrinomonadaceae bacterium]